MCEREAFLHVAPFLNATRNRENLGLQLRFYTPPPRLKPIVESCSCIDELAHSLKMKPFFYFSIVTENYLQVVDLDIPRRWGTKRRHMFFYVQLLSQALILKLLILQIY